MAQWGVIKGRNRSVATGGSPIKCCQPLLPATNVVCTFAKTFTFAINKTSSPRVMTFAPYGAESRQVLDRAGLMSFTKGLDVTRLLARWTALCLLRR